VAADATGIRLTDGALTSVKVGVAFTASEQVGATGKRRLIDRLVFADRGEVDAFGQALALGLETRYGAHLVPNIMLLGDGEPRIAALTADWIPGARYPVRLVARRGQGPGVPAHGPVPVPPVAGSGLPLAAPPGQGPPSGPTSLDQDPRRTDDHQKPRMSL
jgi:hypothetical protein